MTTTKQSFLNKTRNDKFILVLSAPLAIAEDADRLGLNDIQMSVYGSPVPSINIPAEVVNWKGQQYKVTSMSRDSYDDLQVNFTIDNDFKNYWFLWRWLDILNKVEDTGMDPYFNEYSDFNKTGKVSGSGKTLDEDIVKEIKYKEVINKKSNKSVYPDYQIDLTLFGIDEYNNKKIKFTYTDAFITNLGEIAYNYRDSDQAECSVNFAFSQLHAELVNDCE